jgi:Autochaperone Domain Type 1
VICFRNAGEEKMKNARVKLCLLTSTSLGFGVLALGSVLLASHSFAACVTGNPGTNDIVCTGATVGGVNINTGAGLAPTLINNGSISNSAGIGVNLTSTDSSSIKIRQNIGGGLASLDEIIGATTGLSVNSRGGIQYVQDGSGTIEGKLGYGADLTDSSLNGILFAGFRVIGTSDGLRAIENGAGRININIEGPLGTLGSVTSETANAVSTSITSATNNALTDIVIHGVIAANGGVSTQTSGTGFIDINFDGTMRIVDGDSIRAYETNTNSSGLKIVTKGSIEATGTGGAIDALSYGSIVIDNAATMNVARSGIVARGAGGGKIDIANSGSILGKVGSPGSLEVGIFANSIGPLTSPGPSVDIRNLGNIGSVTDQVQIYGIYAGKGIGSGAGDVSVSNVFDTSAIYAKGTAIYAESYATSGSINIGARGKIISQDGLAINVLRAATSASDDINIDLDNALVTGGDGAILAQTGGLGDVNISIAGGIVSTTKTGQTAIDIRAGNGNISIGNSGTISANSTIDPNNIAINISRQVTSGGANIVNGGTIDGRIMGNIGIDNLINYGSWYTFGLNDFAGGGDRILNAGLVNASGSSAGSQNATILKNIDGLYNYATGVMSLSDQHLGDGSNISDTLTIEGRYGAASGATLKVDAFLGGAGSLSDELIITGDLVAGGTTFIEVIDTNAGAGSLNTAGIDVVKVNGAVNANDFALKNGPINKGLFVYDLKFNAGTQIFQLISSLNSVANESPIVPTSLEGLWHDTMTAWVDHQNSIRDVVSNDGTVTAVADPEIPGAAHPQRVVWIAVNGLSADHTGSGLASPGYEQKTLFITGGADFGLVNDDSKFMFGLLGGYLNSNVNVAASPTNMQFEGGSFGVYADYISQGLFLNTTAKADFLNMKFNSIGGRANAGARSIGMRSDAGYRFESGVTFVEPMVSVAAEWTSVDDFFVGGTAVHSGTNNSFRIGAGARVGMKVAAVEASLTARIWDELGKAPTVAIAGSSITAGNFGGIFGEVGGQLNLPLTESLTAFADSNVKFGANEMALSATGGLNFKW